MNYTDIISESEVYEWLGKKRTAIWKLRRDSQFPQPLLSHPARYSKSAIQKWLDNGGTNQRHNRNAQ